MFSKILIANRGEIACRIIETARRMGIATVAVYSEADREACHVALADEAVYIGPAPSRDSYLQQARIIAASLETGAQAVHPGYGFLSENDTFARRLEEAGIAFIGPKHGAIAAMGDKIASKKLAEQARVNTIPGHNAPILSPDQAVAIARDLGYPVMIKASAGGGGKGLRVARDDTETREGFCACRSEALSSFADDRVFIEKLVPDPRHIEIQILADGHGQCVYLWERDCSIQRRHQKLIEEAPSPFLDEDTRRAMGEQAVALARAVGYQSAGTVEFIVSSAREFYFLEMNTRLQVEHPVTEAITGLDLVEQMIRVAAGERLTLTQDAIARRGWAIECRINAEDPARDFLPSTGRLVRFQPPPQTMAAAVPLTVAATEGADLGAAASASLDGSRLSAAIAGGVRVDTGVVEGGEISPYYDSMIAKLIVHGRDRADAIDRMRAALDAFVIRGLRSNIGFQAALMGHPAFATGDVTTGFIAEHFPHGYQPRVCADGRDGANAARTDRRIAAILDWLTALAVVVHRRLRERAAQISGQLNGHEARVAGQFVAVTVDPIGSQHHTPVSIQANSEGWYTVRITARERSDHGWQVRLIDPVRVIAIRGEVAALDAAGTPGPRRPFCAQIERRGLSYEVSAQGLEQHIMVMSPRAAALNRLMPFKPPPDLSRQLLSPMPGLLVGLFAKPGQHVVAGQKLAIIEAMKMANTLVAARDAVVAEVSAEQGDSLVVNQVILQFEA